MPIPPPDEVVSIAPRVMQTRTGEVGLRRREGVRLWDGKEEEEEKKEEPDKTRAFDSFGFGVRHG